MESGIYCILNKTDLKCYIGLTTSLCRRKGDHMTRLKNNNHHNNHLQSVYNKHGKDVFDFEVIERCAESDLADREQYWITFYNSFKNGYNQTLGGEGKRQPCKHKSLSDKQVTEIRNKARAGVKQKDLKVEYNYSKISDVVNNNRYVDPTYTPPPRRKRTKEEKVVNRLNAIKGAKARWNKEGK